MNAAMTPAQAAALSKRGRKLLRRGRITHREYALLDALVWSCRAPGRAEAVVSYTALQRLAHMARETVARGLRTLESLGLLVKVRRRVRLGWMSRQATNLYRFPLEFDGPTAISVPVRKEVCIEAESHAVTSAQAALARVRERMEARMRSGHEKAPQGTNHAGLLG